MQGLIEALKGLIQSRKAVVMIVALVAVCSLAWTGKIQGSQALDFTKWVVGFWMVAHGVQETGASKELTAGSSASAVPVATAAPIVIPTDHTIPAPPPVMEEETTTSEAAAR